MTVSTMQIDKVLRGTVSGTMIKLRQMGDRVGTPTNTSPWKVARDSSRTKMALCTAWTRCRPTCLRPFP